MHDQEKLSRYSCEYCFRKKIRCSRERPKCSNCREWSSACEYTRDATVSTRNKPPRAPRKDLVLPKRPFKKIDSQHGHPSHGSANVQIGTEILPSTMTSTLQHSQKVVKDNVLKNITPEAVGQGNELLKDLHRQFIDSEYAFDSLRSEVHKARRKSEMFFIPLEPIGRLFTQVFLAGIESGYPIVSQPPPEILFDLVFRPSEVPQRGWVLIFNTILATAAPQTPQLSDFVFQLRWNTWLAADESSIYLEPNPVNIQALMLFASHAQDIVPPNLCWNLLCQACRMAQMVKLHVPSTADPRDSETYAQRLCLFWALFALDKSLSLAFGYPPVLHASLYKRVELPSTHQLAEYQPHIKRCGARDKKISPFVKYFGAFFFIQVTKLAMIMGEISDYYLFENPDHDQCVQLNVNLDRWIDVIRQQRDVHNAGPVPSEALKASIDLGFDFLEYRYHHLLVSLTRSNENLRSLCLKSSRAAISLLSTLVSHSEEVYNGIIWELLYYPFTPFFILFGEVVSNPVSSTCFIDLQLMRQTVLYYLEFQKFHSSAVRLEHVAESFTKIAEAYVRQFFKTKGENYGDSAYRAASPTRKDDLNDSSSMQGDPVAEDIHSILPATSRLMHCNNVSQSPLGSYSSTGEMVYLGDTPTMNSKSLFGFFSNPDQQQVQKTQNSSAMEGEHLGEKSTSQHSKLNPTVEEAEPMPAFIPGQYVSMKDVEMHAQLQFSNCNFDWFAFETQYPEMEEMGIIQ